MSENSVSKLPQPYHWRYPAKVLGCLQTGYLAVIVGYGLGMANGGEVDYLRVEMIPVDLRMPNSEFDVLLDRLTNRYMMILRKGEPFPS